MRYVSYVRSASCLDRNGCVREEEDIVFLQEEHIRAYADMHGFLLGEAYRDTDNSEGERTEFDRLFADGMQRKFDFVIVDSIFRCGESFWRAKEVLLETFHYAGIYFIVVEDDFNSFEAGNEGAEAYFAKKYREYRSRTMLQSESRGKEVKSRGSRATSFCSGLVFDKETGAKLSLQKEQDERIYFRLAGAGRGHQILAEEVEEKVFAYLKAEKRSAEFVFEKLEAGDQEGECYLEQQLMQIGKEMCPVFENALKAADRMLVCETPEAHQKQMESILNLEPSFEALMKQAEILETAVSRKNPWMTRLLAWDGMCSGDKKQLRQLIEAVYVKEYTEITVIVKGEEWKKLLPRAWIGLQSER